MADFGEILKNIGEFGLFQKLVLVSVCFPNFLQPFMLASFLFVQSDPERHCNTDWILQADSNLTRDEQLNLTLPRDEDGTFSRCRMFVPVDWDIGAIREFGLNDTTGCQNGWVYYNMLYDATIVTDFDLVCDKVNLVEVIQTVYMAGILVGSIIFGPFGESFGRKRSTQTASVILFIFTVTTALCPNVYLYLVSQFLVGIGTGGYRINSIILATEWMGPSKRSWGACVTQLSVAAGQCVLAGVMYGIRHWRVAQLIAAVPRAVVVTYIWFIPESARWLLSRGRTEEAKQLIVKAAAINKRIVPDSLLDNIAVRDVGNKGDIKIIFRSPVLTKYLVIIIMAIYMGYLATVFPSFPSQCMLGQAAYGKIWEKFAVSLSIFCLHFNIANFGFNIFVTQLLFGIIEIPALFLCMWLLEVVGRKILYTATVLFGGLFCLLVLAVPREYAIAVTSLVVGARFFLIGAITISTVFVQELFPTSIRQTATALGITSARIGALFAPLLNILAIYHWFIPTTVFGSLTLIGGALSFVLPETRRKELPESAEEAENNRNQTSTNTASCSNPNSTKL